MGDWSASDGQQHEDFLKYVTKTGHTPLTTNGSTSCLSNGNANNSLDAIFPPSPRKEENGDFMLCCTRDNLDKSVACLNQVGY